VHSIITLARFSSKSLEMVIPLSLLLDGVQGNHHVITPKMLTQKQLLRLSETLLIKISERRVESTPKTPTFPLDALAVTKVLREITVLLLKDNYCLTSLHVKAIEKLSEEGNPHLDQHLESLETEVGPSLFFDFIFFFF